MTDTETKVSPTPEEAAAQKREQQISGVVEAMAKKLKTKQESLDSSLDYLQKAFRGETGDHFFTTIVKQAGIEISLPLYAGAKVLVGAAKEDPHGPAAIVTNFVLDHWEKAEAHNGERELYRRYGERARHLIKPEHFGQAIARKVAEDVAFGEALKWVDDHILGNHVNLHLFKQKGLNDAVEAGADTVLVGAARFAAEKAFRNFQDMTAVAMFAVNEPAMRQRLQRMAGQEIDHLQPISDRLAAKHAPKASNRIA